MSAWGIGQQVRVTGAREGTRAWRGRLGTVIDVDSAGHYVQLFHSTEILLLTERDLGPLDQPGADRCRCFDPDEIGMTTSDPDGW